MTPIICPSCKAELTEYKRFCPECGARIPEAEAPAAPTVILPPLDVPPANPTPSAVPPTVRLDAPAAPTVILPPIPPTMTPASADTPTMLGAEAPVPQTPPTAAPGYGGQLPPALPTGGPSYGGQLPTGDPAYTGGQLPPGGAPPAAPPNRRNLWLLFGGVGCLSVVLLAVCVIGVLTLLGQRVEDVESAATAESGPLGGGGIVPDDSPLAGGTVLLEDNFENAAASGLGTDEDESSRYAYEDGAYVIEVKEAETIVWAGVDGSYDNVRVSVETEVPPGADVSAAGLIFNYQDSDNFYLFSISNDGYYALELLQGNEWVSLIDWTESPAVDAVRNLLRVETDGERITLYVNDELLEETSDGTFTEGEVALALSSLADSTAEVRFDNLVIEANE